jgi:LPPG:FO 2-phospho-L-lactate transferase
MNGDPGPKCIALSGGVGGAKLALGLSLAMDPERLLIVANTGDDFEHLGLTVCPDLDTLTYTLAGLANAETGWGRADEGWRFMDSLEAFGGETWFRLGDRDLALHVERTRRLAAGEPLRRITADICGRLGIKAAVVPMSDDPVRTIVETPGGPLPFQQYFVREQCKPVVTGFHFGSANDARPNRTFLKALKDPVLEAIVICPSNPFISVDPILALPGVPDALAASAAPVIAVSPIVGGRALKGPTAKMMGELGLQTDAIEIARHYGRLLDGYVLDRTDAALAPEVESLGVAVRVAETVMQDQDDKVALAETVLSFAHDLTS